MILEITEKVKYEHYCSQIVINPHIVNLLLLIFTSLFNELSHIFMDQGIIIVFIFVIPIYRLWFLKYTHAR